MTYSAPAGARPPARQRMVAARRALTVLAVLLLFGGIGYSVWRLSLATPAGAGDATACVTPSPVSLPLQPRKVTVNVYNATNRTGLAARTARELSTYGFRIGKVANDPLGKSLRGAAEIRGGRASTKQITVLRAYVDKETVVRDKRKGTTVDLVLGARFTGLGGPATRAEPTGPGCT